LEDSADASGRERQATPLRRVVQTFRAWVARRICVAISVARQTMHKLIAENRVETQVARRRIKYFADVLRRRATADDVVRRCAPAMR
jgi:hypothetical protein